MLTIGVDLSAEDAKTCLATVRWTDGCASVETLSQKVSNEQIVSALADAEVMGIDAPFGWPLPFVDFLTEHSHGSVAARSGAAIEWRRALANRTTDLFIRDKTKLIPLSVSADRIAHAAMRCASLLSELAAVATVDRSGQSGKVVEVYPAASLLQWGLPHRGYKGQANVEHLGGLVDTLKLAAPWLSLGKHEEICRSSDDAFDAVIASLSARAVRRGETFRPDDGQTAVAKREGWIALPVEGSLTRLTSA